MKKLLFLFFCVSAMSLRAQFQKVLVKVDGLTCAACSYATQHAILQLDFVSDVQMDMNTNMATVTFKSGKKVDIAQVAEKVKEAGFSVGALTAAFDISGAEMAESKSSFTYKTDTYHLLGGHDRSLSGIVNVKFVGDAYMKKSELKKWKSDLKNAGSGAAQGQSVYYIAVQ